MSDSLADMGVTEDTAGEPCRVTICGTHGRVDVALPQDVPLADLLADLLAMTEEQDLSERAHLGWGLSRLGQHPLDPNRSLAELGVRNGELLYLRPASQLQPPPVYDDVVDVVAAASKRWGQAWGAPASRRAGIVIGAGLIELGILPLLSSPGRTTSSVIAVVVAVVLLAAGTAASRAFGDGDAGAILTFASLGYAFVAGLGLIQPHGPALARVPLLGAWAGLLVAAVIGALGAARWVAGFTFAVVGGLAGIVATACAVASGAPAVQVAGATGVVAVGVLLTAPALAIRLGGLRPPAVAWDAARTDRRVEPPDTPLEEQRTRLALDLLTGIVLATSATVVAATCLLALAGHRFELVLAGLLTGALLLRARAYRAVPHVLTLVSGAMASALTVVVVQSATAAGQGTWRWLFVTAVAAGTAGVTVGMSAGRRNVSPRWSHLLDLVEGLVVIALIPVGLQVLNLYTAVRSGG